MLSIIQKRWVMLCLFVMMCIFGYYSWKQLSIEAYPDIADVTSQVVTQVPGLAAEEVEQQITIPLERAINGLPGMHVMRSKSTFGLSMITIVFKDGTEDYWSRQRVQERLNEVELPYGAVPGLDPLTSPVGEVYRYIIESDQHSLRELTDLQNWEIIPRIKEVSGVADVTNFGGITTQFQVEVDPSKLEQYNLSLSQVVEAIENNNANVGGSVLNRGDLGYVVRGIGLIGNLDDLGHIVVSTTSGVPVFLNDIGSLKYGNLERKGVLGYTDRTRNYSESLEGIVLLLKHENPSKVLEDIHVAVDELNNETLPEGVRIHTFLDRTNLVDTTLSTVSHTLLMGMALVVLVLILFLGNWRGALLVSITIPVSLLIAFILMHLTDIPANLLSLGAIDFGIIVDGAIVMLETILKKREDNPKQYLEEKSMAQRAKEVGRPILFSTIVIITAYLPLFAFERVERKLFTPMAFTMSYAMIGALLVALLLIPGLAYAIYRKPHKIYKNKWLDRLKDKYIRTITGFLEAPLKAIIPSGLILTAGIVLSVVVGKDFLPELDEGSIWLQVNLPPGISVEKSRELSDTLRARTMKYSEVTYIMVQAGRNDDGTDPFTPSHFEVSIGIKPYDEWPKGKTKKDLIHELEEEYKSLMELITELKAILADEKKLLGVIKEEILAISDKYGDERRTSIGFDEYDISMEDMIPVTNTVITFTKLGYIKRMNVDNFKSQHRGGKGIKGMETIDEDYIVEMMMTTSHHYLMFFTNTGRVYRLKAYEIPECSRTARGTAIVNLLQLQPDEKITSMIPIKEYSDSQYLFMATKNGIVKKTKITDYENIRKTGLAAINLREDDRLIEVKLTDNNEDIILITKFGQCIRFHETDVRNTGRTSMGVIGMSLTDQDEVIAMQLASQGDSLMIVSAKGLGKCTLVEEFTPQNRGGKGVKCYKITEKTGNVVGCKAVNEDDEMMLINTEGIIIRIKVNDIALLGRITSGVKLINVGEGVTVASIAKVRKEDMIMDESEENQEDSASEEEDSTEE